MYYIYVDEAGRWPIAWPVYVGLVVVKSESNDMRRWDDISSLPWMWAECYSCYDDSKIIPEQKREDLYNRLTADKSILFSSWSSKSTEVDSHGIVRWIRTAIARALRKYFDHGEKYSHSKFIAWVKKHAHEFTLVVDGKTDFGIRKLWWVSVIPVVDGDAKIPMISAASIIAKVERDREMRKIHKKFPRYGFNTHKWYWTAT